LNFSFSDALVIAIFEMNCIQFTGDSLLLDQLITFMKKLSRLIIPVFDVMFLDISCVSVWALIIVGRVLTHGNDVHMHEEI
tara:strand:- start:1988 stop:2230 length:243 start_codon:yes stop_codon:yes gene_type:complete